MIRTNDRICRRKEKNMTRGMDSPFEEREGGPTSIDATDNQNSIEVSVAESQEEKVQEQNTEIEQVQEESRISKGKQGE